MAATKPPTMKAVPFMKACAPKDLKILDFKKPEIKPNEVLVKVKAFGINFADVVGRKGQYQAAPPFPFVPGYEVAGDVVEVGAEASEFKVGDKVFAMTDFGGYAQYARCRKAGASHIPEGWTYEQAASVPVSFVTAYHSLYMTGPVLPKAKILIHACAGGLGMALTQMAKAADLEVFGTCGSDAKMEIAKQNGVDHPINYRTQQFEKIVMEKTDGKGVDIIIDSIAGSYFKRDFSCLSHGGRVVGVGAAGFTQRSLTNILSLLGNVISMKMMDSIELMLKSKSFCGVNMKEIGDNRPDLLVYEFNQVLAMFAKKDITFLPISEYTWDQIGQVHADLENRKTTGKLVMTIPEESSESSPEGKTEENNQEEKKEE